MNSKTTKWLAIVVVLASLFSVEAISADRFKVIAQNNLVIARKSETIVIPFAEVKSRLPDVVFDQVIVRDSKGRVIPSQVTSFVHSHKGPQQFDELIFQHDFAAGEKTASFTVEKSESAIAPFPSKIYIRYVPERYDDFAWENDLVGHRAYGPGLELPSAGKDQMVSSGLDVWTKKVRYSVIDHWYHKGHDGLHTDTGEGLDMYEVGMNRGAGGTGIWDGKQLAVSKNYRTWKILANGPIRGVFELGYEPWDAGGGVMVSEVKRFTVDAGHYLDQVESTFTFSPKSGDNSLTVGIGLSEHTTIATVSPLRNDQQRSISLWEEYKDPQDGKLGTAVMLAPTASFAGFAELPATPGVSRLVRPDLLVLAKVQSGEHLRYWVGGAWDKAGLIASQKAWTEYLANVAARNASPITIRIEDDNRK
jgi:hypothetical protein